MTLKELFELSLNAGIDADPRGRAGIEKNLARRKTSYDKLSEDEKKDFDLEDLTNPYSDSRILTGDPTLTVKKVMAGIDIDASEVLLADRLNEKGAGIDVIVAHHPIGGALADLHSVMDMQADVMAKYGVPINIAEGLMNDHIQKVGRHFNPLNHTQASDAARMLNLALMCTHTITDNLVYDFFEKLIAEKKPETVGDVMDMLKEIPEYQEAVQRKAGPSVYVGDRKNRAGIVAPLEVTGGTDASHTIYERLAQAGVGTIIAMHASDKHREEAQKNHINLINAGHMSSDSIGMNLLLDKFEQQGIEVVPCSGLIRVKRS